MAKTLSGTKTHENLKHAFAGESQANRRYLYFARRIVIDHPQYQARTVLRPETRDVLAAELSRKEPSTSSIGM
jgi:hypothetical protein